MLVFFASFITFTVIFLQLVGPFLDEAEAANWDYPDSKQLAGESMTYSLYEPTAGYDISDADILDQYERFYDDAEANTRKTFYQDVITEDKRLMVNVIRDNQKWDIDSWFGFDSPNRRYEDYVMIAQKYGWFSVHYKPISYETIADNYEEGSNMSFTPFMLGSHNVTLIVTIDADPENLTEGIYRVLLFQDDYNLKIGVPVFQNFTVMGHSSVWNTLGAMLTMQLPNTHWVVDALIAAPCWTAIGFCFFMVVRSLIPLLGG